MQRPGCTIRPLRDIRAQGAGRQRQDSRVRRPPHGLHVTGHVRRAICADSQWSMRVSRPVVRADRLPVRRWSPMSDAPQPH